MDYGLEKEGWDADEAEEDEDDELAGQGMHIEGEEDEVSGFGEEERE